MVCSASPELRSYAERVITKARQCPLVVGTESTDFYHSKIDISKCLLVLNLVSSAQSLNESLLVNIIEWPKAWEKTPEDLGEK